MAKSTDDIVGTFYRGFSGDTDLFDQVLAEDWDDIPLGPGQTPGRAGAAELVKGIGAVVRDVEILVHDLVDGRKPDGSGLVAARAEMRGVQEGEWFGVPGTGQPFRVRIHEFHQIADDRIVRTWHLEDWHGWLQQAGAQGQAGARGSTMRALRITGYGTPAELVEMPRPAPGPGEVLVHVSGAALNPLDVKLAAGYMHDFFPVEFPYTVGTDLSGIIAGVGEGVERWAVGDRIVTRTDPTAGGAVAEFALVPAEQLVSAPTSVTLATAAGIGTAAATAWQALHEVADIRAGQTVLVQAGAGGVGSFVVQLAHRAGARVIATASGAGVDIARRLGADEVIDYTTTELQQAVSDVDVVIDGVGGKTELASLGVLRPGGVLVSLPVPPDADQAAAHGVRAAFFAHTSDAVRLARVVALVDDGVEVLVDRTVALDDAAAALDAVAAGRAKGKIIIRTSAE